MVSLNSILSGLWFGLDFNRGAPGALGDGVRGYVHFAGNKFRDVVRLQARGIDIERLLGQQEGFVHFAFGTDVRKIELCEQSAVPAAGEHYPFSVGRPGVIAFRIFAVGFAGDFLFGLQVDHPEVGFLMPDRETTVIQVRAQQETPVGGDAWEYIATAGVVNRVDLAVELQGGGIETDAANRVL